MKHFHFGWNKCQVSILLCHCCRNTITDFGDSLLKTQNATGLLKPNFPFTENMKNFSEITENMFENDNMITEM
jgi:hypothetical protein